MKKIWVIGCAVILLAAQRLMAKLGRIGSSRPDVETEVSKTVRFVPEDLSVYDRHRELNEEFERILKVK
ncbi:MAG: hypothetical protein O7B35_18545 [Deltaproteobacteria bacterium]|nr:hypothetical protein [Deltaproteobacteria bacterium]